MIEQGIFRGKPIFIIKNDKRILLSFGLRKAQLILDNIPAIKEFVDANFKETFKISEEKIEQ